ncbi:antitoxin Xre/MbcA/ParS-like domain-containing protein [Sphingomonas oryzagri]
MANLAVEADRPPRIRGLSEGAIRAALQRNNPEASVGDLRTMATIISAVSNALAELPDAARLELAREKNQIRRRLVEVTPGQGVAQRAPIKASGRVIRSRGAGLGESVSLEEGRRRLADHAVARPLESWAGPVAGAGEIHDSLGIPRSTLSNWQQRGVVVGLLRGERKLAYPLDQFVDGRPLEGIADILRLAPDPRSAWLWLRQQHGALDGLLPLELLKSGRRADVVKVAERDFA